MKEPEFIEPAESLCRPAEESAGGCGAASRMTSSADPRTEKPTSSTAGCSGPAGWSFPARGRGCRRRPPKPRPKRWHSFAAGRSGGRGRKHTPRARGRGGPALSRSTEVSGRAIRTGRRPCVASACRYRRPSNCPRTRRSRSAGDLAGAWPRRSPRRPPGEARSLSVDWRAARRRSRIGPQPISPRSPVSSESVTDQVPRTAPDSALVRSVGRARRAGVETEMAAFRFQR